MFLGCKNVGESMLSALRRETAEIPGRWCFANKLDPMASGVFTIYSAERRNCLDLACGFDKIYTCDILIGGPITSSTDILSDFIEGDRKLDKTALEIVLKALSETPGETLQKPNRYSATKIRGKPVWQWSKEGRFDEIRDEYYERRNGGKIVNIYEANLLAIESFSPKEILEDIVLPKLSKLPDGDFDKELREESWKNLVWRNSRYNVVSMEFKVSSGTFIRQIVKDVGKEVGVNLTVLQICRTDIVIR